MSEARPITTFELWMRACRFNDQQAAQHLGLKPHTVSYLRKGVNPRGERYLPREDTRLLMRVIAEGWRPRPWPE